MKKSPKKPAGPPEPVPQPTKPVAAPKSKGKPRHVRAKFILFVLMFLFFVYACQPSSPLGWISMGICGLMLLFAMFIQP